MNLNRAIFRELQRQGRTQRWLARQLDVDESLLSRWKRGLEIPPEKAALACDLLSLAIVSPDGESLFRPDTTVTAA